MARHYEVMLRPAFGQGMEIKRIVSANTKRSAARISRMVLRRDIGVRAEAYVVAWIRYIPMSERKT